MRRRLDHLLEVVQDEEKPLVPQGVCKLLGEGAIPHFPHPEDPSHGWRDEVRITDGRKGNEGDAVGEVTRQLLRHPQRQSSLTDASRTSQGNEAHVVLPEQRHDGGHLPPGRRTRSAGPAAARGGPVGGGSGRRAARQPWPGSSDRRVSAGCIMRRGLPRVNGPPSPPDVVQPPVLDAPGGSASSPIRDRSKTPGRLDGRVEDSEARRGLQRLGKPGDERDIP